MDKKGQVLEYLGIDEVSPVAMGLGIFAAIVGFIIASRMEGGIVIQIASAFVCGVAGFIIATKMSTK